MSCEDNIIHDAYSDAGQEESLPLPDNTSPLADCQSPVGEMVIDIGQDSPFFPCDQCDLKKKILEQRCESAYWKAMHKKVREREALHIQENHKLQARIKELEGMVFGKSSEKETGKSGEGLPGKKSGRKRGQQPGAPGHGRRERENLPVIDEDYDLPENEKFCPCCHLPFISGFGMEESEVVEVEVRGYVRRIRRKQYMKICTCKNVPAIITAKGPAKLIPRCTYGDSIWIEVLLDKYFTFRPTHRLIQSQSLNGLDLPQGTITDGLKRLMPLFEPVYQAIIVQNQSASHWHADETRWMVFSKVEGKQGYRWYLWVFQSDDSCVFILDQTRSSKVPEAHLQDVINGFLSVDRYSAYKVVAKNGFIILSFCWSHVRRDFIVVAKGYPSLEEWAIDWVQDIGTLYHLNELRLTSEADSPEQIEAQIKLEDAIENMAQKRDEQLAQPTLPPPCEKVLKSLDTHWEGLTLFVDNPELPMDNNSAERCLRGPVSGRKSFYGSGSEWSGTLAVMMFTIFQTLAMWDINPKTWLQFFFRACAENGSKTPDDLSAFLPWTMDEERKAVLRLPPSPPPRHDTS